MRLPSFFQTALIGLAMSASSVQAVEYSLPRQGEDLAGQIQVIKAKYEDTFADYGDRYSLGYLEMVAANPGVDPWLPGAGTDVVLPTRYILPPGPRSGIVINLPEYRMYYYSKGQNIVYTYPLGIGRGGWESPVTTTRITTKIKNPSWYPPQSVRKEHAVDGDVLPAVIPPGPDNPLGPMKMNLALSGYLIHGSNKHFGIGTQTSHGCFRMLNPDVLALSGMVPVGTSVRIIYETVKVGYADGKLYLEVHSELEGKHQSKDNPQALIEAMLKRHPDLDPNIDWDIVNQIIRDADGIPVEITGSAPAQQTAYTQ